MATPVLMPQVGITVETCILTKWLKQKGDPVKAGDKLFSYETDKSSFEEEAKCDGVLLETFAAEGDDIPVLQCVCVIGQAGEDVSSFAPSAASASEAAPAAAPAESAAPAAPAVPDSVTPVLMPQVGITVETCILTKWFKQKGDTVKVGDKLFSYETDKSSFEEEARADGVLLDVFAAEGDDIPVLQCVCVIGEAGVDVSALNPKAQAGAPAPAEEKTAAPASAPAAAPAPSTAPTPSSGDFIRISPRARNLAGKTGADVRYASPTGPNGRIIERDVRALLENGPVATSAAKDAYLALDAPITGTGIGGRITVEDLMNAAKAAPAAASAPSAAAAPADEVEVVKLPPIRKSIAKAMVGSLSSMAQLTLTSSFDASEIMAYRAKLKANAENLGLANITYNDMVLFAVARTLADAQFKALNANLIDDEMHYFKSVNLGVAVDTDRGLMVPTVMGANHKSLDQIAGEVKELAAQCKDGGIAPDKLKGASFTVSNLGSQGIESFTPVINPPQTGILGVNTIEYRVKMVKGEQVVYPAMGLSLTFDHRALDGLPAAKFLKAVVTNLENFSLLLAK